MERPRSEMVAEATEGRRHDKEDSKRHPGAGSEMINRATERMAEIATRSRARLVRRRGNRQITATMEDVNRMVGYLNNVIREQSRNTVKVLEAIGAVKKVSVDNIDKAVETDRAVEKMALLNGAMMEMVKRFKLKK
jgi:methyl-accepting chemotaxis protein